MSRIDPRKSASAYQFARRERICNMQLGTARTFFLTGVPKIETTQFAVLSFTSRCSVVH
jgi:hypothetical protein